MKPEVVNMIDMSKEHINELFNRQIQELTKRTCAENTFDYQFSDRWLQ